VTLYQLVLHDGTGDITGLILNDPSDALHASKAYFFGKVIWEDAEEMERGTVLCHEFPRGLRFFTPND
jgi:hypothetical protein